LAVSQERLDPPPHQAGPAAPFPPDRARADLAMMERIRAFEEQALAAAARGLVLGAIHPSIGQEAVAVGVCGALGRDDLLLSTHRGHGHTLAKGADARAMMRELLGRAGGSCGGKGGSMHIADFAVGMLGANGVVGANIVIAAGAAHAVKLRGQARIVACLFGDGAINRGPFLEGLNWAAINRLPLFLVCEDNRYAATTVSATTTAGPGAAARAEALGIPATCIDGNDVGAVRAAAERLVGEIRAGSGPRLLHAITYRRTGHTAADAANYRPPGEAERQAAEDDPIDRARAALAAAGWPAADLEALREAARAEMAAALAEAEAAPWPDAATAFADVQDLGSPAERPF
jgi:TPP-dependent pyruvate/acetoin dehydrogenase alpha subunit